MAETSVVVVRSDCGSKEETLDDTSAPSTTVRDCERTASESPVSLVQASTVEFVSEPDETALVSTRHQSFENCL